MNFLKKLLGIDKESHAKSPLKKTPEIQAAEERIKARQKKEALASSDKQRRERLVKNQSPTARASVNQPVSAQEELRRLERRAQQNHSDKLQADSGLMANSKMDLWLNSIAPEDPPDTIAPHLRIPDTVFNIDTNKFEKS
ncbi:hypothetical protein H8K33_11195 [Undibacterium amnicola]|uniref:Uncharacterized protein n=1 Tax=Undibacterium amnicola TaxID=1834038 RepID=A0ABR6XRF7_9BURK|nr:hypothetical protein [Undibacterium amnicola]MBC3832077.1 hypothetical protein [Undibacterium amnicola]